MKAMTSSMFIACIFRYVSYFPNIWYHLIQPFWASQTSELQYLSSSRHWSPSDWRGFVVLEQNESSIKHALMMSKVWTSSSILFSNELHFFSQQDLYHQNKHHHISKPILNHYFQVTQGWRYIFHQKMKHLQKKVRASLGYNGYNMQVTFSISQPSRRCAAVRRVEYHSSPSGNFWCISLAMKELLRAARDGCTSGDGLMQPISRKHVTPDRPCPRHA